MMGIQSLTSAWLPRRLGVRADSGFTLLELLVALVLLSLAMLIIPSTLRLAMRATNTSTELIEQASGAASMRFFAQSLAGAMPLFARNEEGKLQIAFTGSPNSVAFVAPLTGGPDGGGLYRMQLRAIADGETGRQNLVLSIQRYADAASSEMAPEQRPMSGGLTSAQFRYFGVPEGKQSAEWSPLWTRGDRLPDLVEVVLITSGALEDQRTVLRIEPRLRSRI